MTAPLGIVDCCAVLLSGQNLLQCAKMPEGNQMVLTFVARLAIPTKLILEPFMNAISKRLYNNSVFLYLK
jgi:hypothetical protein